ncbi:hypothetical protein JCM5353_003580 [Sporobolomyces roseus]
MSNPAPAYYTDCQSCRIIGTGTFSLVGLYALTIARMQAKSQFGKGIASLSGLGFLAIAAARWTSYTPPPTLEQSQAPVQAAQQANRQV